ncbi:MAG TPA: sensor histidine kinase, partial [Polyangiaceae bacterium]|nr:sensor histidine kinase [Polyangiaceae bacterium]
MHPSFEPQVSLPWLARLRWLALAGQFLAVALARVAFDERPRWAPLLAALLAGAASNLWLARRARRRADDPAAARLVGGVLSLDALLLTALLASSGGATNPLSVLYLVYVALAAVVLGTAWTALLALASIVSFAALFALPEAASPHAAHAHAQHGRFAGHLYEMWVAFTLAAALVAYFLRKIATTIAEQREQIARLRESAARNARLASITTLAAGAAHELGTPLGTISVAAREVELSASRLPGAEAILEDMRLILEEVERCDEILGKLSARAEAPDGARGARVDELAEPLRDRLG